LRLGGGPFWNWNWKAAAAAQQRPLGHRAARDHDRCNEGFATSLLLQTVISHQRELDWDKIHICHVGIPIVGVIPRIRKRLGT
jgi:hypothetical protein